METIHRFSIRLHPILRAEKCLRNGARTSLFRKIRLPISQPIEPTVSFTPIFTTWSAYSSASPQIARAGWFLGLGEKKKLSFPDIIKAGDPVLHEPARDVDLGEIGSEKIQKIIDDMIMVMRKAPGVGLAAPQIGIPLRVSFGFKFHLYSLQFCNSYLVFFFLAGKFA